MPLPLLDLDEEPLLTRLVKLLSGIAGLQHVVVVTNEAIKPALEAWRQGLPSGMKPVRVVGDGTHSPQDRKGAVGDLIFAADTPDDVAVLASDNWFTYDLSEFIFRARSKSPALVVTPRRPNWQTSRYGMVGAAPDGRIVEFVEKPASSLLGHVATCVYYFGKADLRWLDAFAREHTTACSMGTFTSWLVGKTAVYAHEMTATWYDIGEVPGKLLIDGALARFKQVVRSIYDPRGPKWERPAARLLQWVTSPEDLLEFLHDPDADRRIIAARILGTVGHLLNAEGRSVVTEGLLQVLDDGGANSYESGGADENAPIYVAATAAESLAALGYGVNAHEVFARVRQAGRIVEELTNKY
ncbi:MAG: hypothetical protein HY289_06895 [Planctomycetes bacterium]|nr:hypothetical protein [Planctomycetota bacterium]